jgi:hypothetical protein
MIKYIFFKHLRTVTIRIEGIDGDEEDAKTDVQAFCCGDVFTRQTTIYYRPLQIARCATAAAELRVHALHCYFFHMYVRTGIRRVVGTGALIYLFIYHL